MRYAIRIFGWLIVYAAVTTIVLLLLGTLGPTFEGTPKVVVGMIVGLVITVGIALGARWYYRERKEDDTPV